VNTTRQIRRDDPAVDLVAHARAVARGDAHLSAAARADMQAAITTHRTAAADDDDGGLFECADESDSRASRTGGPGSLRDQIECNRDIAAAYLRVRARSAR